MDLIIYPSLALHVYFILCKSLLKFDLSLYYLCEYFTPETNLKVIVLNNWLARMWIRK